MLVAEDVHKRYGHVTALAGFDLHIDAGEIVGLIGPNGAVATGSQQELLKDLPGQLRVTFETGEERVVSTPEPSRALAQLLADGHVLTAVDLRLPSLDDLFHSLQQSQC